MTIRNFYPLFHCHATTILPLGSFRLRVEHGLAGLGPPMYEDQTLLEADIAQGSKVIIEPGPVPLKSQVKIT